MEISKLKPGQILYDVSRERMGNTTMRTIAVRTVVIDSVAEDGKSFTAKWNFNPARNYYEIPASWKARKPYLVTSLMGKSRLASREERKAAAAIEERSTYFSVRSTLH